MWDYDRVRAIVDGKVRVEGCEVTVRVLPPAECFRRAYLEQEFEVSEIGFSPYLIGLSRGSSPYIALPIFLSRMFRHSAIYVRTDRAIRTPEDLKGKIVGVPEYQMSAALWVRGFLEDLHGVRPADMQWRQGGLEVPGGREKFPLQLPSDFPLEPIPEGRTLSALLAAGELDALISAATPSCYGAHDIPVQRLYEDSEPVERAYYRQTGIFPIMHALGIRHDVHERHPWLAGNLYAAFTEAKALAVKEFTEVDALKIMLPWVGSQYRSTCQFMGEDYWPYGVDPNRRSLEAMTDYSFRQGLAIRKLEVSELFPTGQW
jgi:4,5-dihydroxyphthalate decarboxylase